MAAPTDAYYVLTQPEVSLPNSVLFDDQFALKDTDDLTEGTSNKYWDYNADTNKIINVVDPAANQDAATKIYVDGEITTHTGNENAHHAKSHTHTHASTTGQTASDHQDEVTLAGTPDYITISGQVITRETIDISDDTNLAVNSPITLTGDTLGLDETATYSWTGVHTFGTNVKLQFRGTNNFIHSNTTDEITLQAASLLTLGIAGDTKLGDGTLRAIKPATDEKMDLGTSSNKFNNIFCNLPTADPSVAGQLWSDSGTVKVSAG